MLSSCRTGNKNHLWHKSQPVNGVIKTISVSCENHAKHKLMGKVNILFRVKEVAAYSYRWPFKDSNLNRPTLFTFLFVKPLRYFVRPCSKRI